MFWTTWSILSIRFRVFQSEASSYLLQKYLLQEIPPATAISFYHSLKVTM